MLYIYEPATVVALGLEFTYSHCVLTFVLIALQCAGVYFMGRCCSAAARVHVRVEHIKEFCNAPVLEKLNVKEASCKGTMNRR